MAITTLLENQQVVLDTDAQGWSYLVPQEDPTTSDPDFYETWYYYDSTGSVPPPEGYSYDGPAFTPEAQTPIASDSTHSPIADYPVKTLIPTTPGTQASYFTRVIRGGPVGMTSMNLRMLCPAGAVIYLDGVEIGRSETMDGVEDTWTSLASGSSGDFHDITLAFGQLDPGLHVLAISVHQKSGGCTIGLAAMLTANPADGCDVNIIGGPYIDAMGVENNSPSLSLRFLASGQCSSATFYVSQSLNDLQDARGVEFDLSSQQNDDNIYSIHINNSSLAPISYALTLNTFYFYRLEVESASSGLSTSTAPSGLYSFMTPPSTGQFPPNNRIRIWTTGDSGNGWESSQSSTGKRPRGVFDAYRAVFANEIQQDLAILIGDNAYVSGGDTTYETAMQDAVFDMYQGMFTNTPFLSTRGNHDNNPYYMTIFPADLLQSGNLGGVASNDALYYSFDYGPIHFVCLDSWDYSDISTSDGLRMYNWLQSDLESTPQPWKIVYMHHSPYSFGHYNSEYPDQASSNPNEQIMLNMRRDWAQVLESNGVDLVVAAHCHSYERSYFINGHYGNPDYENGERDSCTFDPDTMIVQEGNGSVFGYVDASGEFIEYEKPDPSYAYRKTSDRGTVYMVEGGGSQPEGWSCPDYDPSNNCGTFTGDCSSSALVNPNPYPAMAVSLYLLGSTIIDVLNNPYGYEGYSAIHVQKIDNYGALRDDFMIAKPNS